MDRITENDPRATACLAPCVRGLVACLSQAKLGIKTGADFHHWAADCNRRAGKGLSASSLISCCDVSHIAFHSEASRRGRHHRLGSRDVRSTGLRVRRVRTRREIGRACNRSGAGAPRFGLRERPRCGGTATRAATPSPGLRRSQRDGRDTRQKAAKAAYRKLPTAPADLRAAAVRRSCGFCADACPIAKRRVARMRDGGARRIQGVPYLSTSDRLSSQIPRPWVAA